MSVLGSAVGASSAGAVEQIIQLRQQVIDRSRLLRELHQAAPAHDTNATAVAATAESGFAATLRSALDGVSATQARAADMSESYERGEITDIASVMLARQESGIAFEATLQVRNKLLAAYQEIMRMGV